MEHDHYHGKERIMSDTNDSVAAQTADVYDYLTEEAAPVEETVVEPEVKEEEVKPEEPPKADDADDVTEEEHKPWKAEKKAETPAWARKRFKQYSTQTRELKTANEAMQNELNELKSQSKSNNAELTRADFPDDEAYNDHRVERKFQTMKDEYEKSNQEKYKIEAETQRQYDVDQQNIDSARADLPDYDEAMQNGDPEVRLSTDVIKHLANSKAGPYVRHRIAVDEGFSEALKAASPQEQYKLVAELHDGVLDYLEKRTPTQAPTTPQQTAAPTAPKKPAPPKAPPKQKTGTKRDMLSLSGDEYIRARNEQNRRR